MVDSVEFFRAGTDDALPNNIAMAINIYAPDADGRPKWDNGQNYVDGAHENRALPGYSHTGIDDAVELRDWVRKFSGGMVGGDCVAS